MLRQISRYIVVVATLLIVVHLVYGPKLVNNIAKSVGLRRKKVHLKFPSSFPLKDQELPQFVHTTEKLRHDRAYKYVEVLKHSGSKMKKQEGQYHGHPFQLYQSNKEIHTDLHMCPDLQANIDSEVSEPQDLNTPLCQIVAGFADSIERGDLEFLNEIAPYFSEQIKLQLKHDVCDKYWYRLAGSSVYLEEYGLHYMVSRLAYSPDGNRRDPKFSFSYAQLYDQDWTEVLGVSLVVPTNDVDPDIDVLGPYKVVHFPSLIPVPFYHSYSDRQEQYLGPEDPRLILVKNKRGHMEPMMVYNVQHEKDVFADDDEDDKLLVKPNDFRSMWVCYPWQSQRGKQNVDLDAYFDRFNYSRAIELRIKNTPRQSKQKNWTPMISDIDRQKDGYDRTVLFVYRWAGLQVLKCDVYTGKCGFIYRQNDRIKTSSGVGPLRGGTQMMNLRQVMADQEQRTKVLQSIIPPNREIWVGFARAHLVSCGCGKDFYRPNLVVITKDLVKEDGKDVELFKISHISSFASFNVEIMPWDPSKPYQLCASTNALIPNGISGWTVYSEGEGDQEIDVKNFLDDLTVAFSVQDSTVFKVTVKNILRMLVTDDTLVMPLGEKTPNNERLLIPNESAVLSGNMPGFNNDNLVCAMLASKKFCSDYGTVKIEDEKNHVLDTVFGTDLEEEELMNRAYQNDLEHFGLEPI